MIRCRGECPRLRAPRCPHGGPRFARRGALTAVAVRARECWQQRVCGACGSGGLEVRGRASSLCAVCVVQCPETLAWTLVGRDAAHSCMQPHQLHMGYSTPPPFDHLGRSHFDFLVVTFDTISLMRYFHEMLRISFRRSHVYMATKRI